MVVRNEQANPRFFLFPSLRPIVNWRCLHRLRFLSSCQPFLWVLASYFRLRPIVRVTIGDSRLRYPSVSSQHPGFNTPVEHTVAYRQRLENALVLTLRQPVRPRSSVVRRRPFDATMRSSTIFRTRRPPFGGKRPQPFESSSEIPARRRG